MCGNLGWWLPGWVDGAKIPVAIYALKIYTALCIMFWMRAYPLPGQVGGLGPWGSRVFWALWNSIEPIGECHLGPKKLEISMAQPPLTCPSNGYAMHASKILCTGLYRNHGCVGGYMHKRPWGRFQSPYCGGWRSRCIRELNRSARAAQVHKWT